VEWRRTLEKEGLVLRVPYREGREGKLLILLLAEGRGLTKKKGA
jgi:hypothetical protein